MSNIRPARDMFISHAPGTPDARGPAPDPAGPFAVQPGEGTALETPTGDTVTIKATTRQTNGSLTVLELVIGPNQGPALHTHLREDELWYVIEGDFRFKAGDAMLRASTGGMAFGPRGTPHCFQNVSDTTPARLLVMFTPAGMERFFEGVAQLPPGPPDPDAWSAIAHSTWMKIVGRPLAETDPL